MKSLILFLGLNIILTCSMQGQCIANYSYVANNETLTFNNLSAISNAHFYWNFGDGSGTNDVSPIHVFPDDGEYLVTLYGLDTITNCVDVIENWITVVKPHTIPCNIYFTGGISGTSGHTTDLSTNCNGYHLGCHVFANAQNICNGFSTGSWTNALFLHGMNATRSDSIYGSRIFNAFYRTLPHNYSSSTNYGNCSANFEVTIDYQTNGALVNFTAMNKSGNSTFTIIGFGNSINLQGSSVSYLYPYISYTNVFPWSITHTKSDSLNGCPSVTCTQTILIRNPFYSWPPNCVISQQPQTQVAISGSTAQFTIDAPDNIIKQWQQDSGLGFINLTNAGPYSGVNTDTLTISNVQPAMNNYHYRCILSGSSMSGCHNTSNEAILYVSAIGIDEIKQIDLSIYPNPATNFLTISGQQYFNEASVKVYNLLGSEVLSTGIDIDNAINVTALYNGIYILELRQDRVIGRTTFIKY